MTRNTSMIVFFGFLIGLAFGCGSSRVPEVSGGGGDKGVAATDTPASAPEIKKGTKLRCWMVGDSNTYTYVVEEVRGNWLKCRWKDEKSPYWVNTNNCGWYQVEN